MFDVGEIVKVRRSQSRYDGTCGRVVIRKTVTAFDETEQVYGLSFEWDPEANPVYFKPEELER